MSEKQICLVVKYLVVAVTLQSNSKCTIDKMCESAK